MIYCSRCGTANNNDANYCINDGFPLNKIKERTAIRHKEEQVSCQSCGADQLPNAQYCPTCGESLAVVQSPIIRKNESTLALKSIKKNDIKKAFLHTIPLVIITVLSIWLLSFISLGKIDSTPFERSEIEQNMDLIEQIHFFSNYEDSKRRALNEESIQFGNSSEGIVDPAVSSLDLMMLSNSVSLETNRYENSNGESDQTTIKKNGLVYYLYLTMITIFLVGMTYSRKKPFTDWKRLLIYSLAFSLIYALIIFILSFFTTQGTEDHNNFTPFTYSFVASDALWKSFLIGFIAIFSGFIMTRGKSLSRLILSMKYAVKLLIMTTLLVCVTSGLLYIFYLNEMSVFQFIEKSAIISAPVVVSQISIVLYNLVFQNAYTLKVAFSQLNSDTQEKIASYHMITKSNTGDDFVQEGFYDSFNNIDHLLWGLVGLVVIVIIYLSKHFNYEQLRDRFKTIAAYSAFFAIVSTLLSYGATFYIHDMSVEYQSNYTVGFSLIMSFIVFFSFTFILTFVSSYIFKTKKEVL